MELTPGERAVLGQIRVLYTTAGVRDQQVKALHMQWPPTHYEAYQRAYGGLLAKDLIEHAGSQLFRITDAGLRLIGVAIPRPSGQIGRPEEKRPAPQVAARRDAKESTKAKQGVLSRLMTGLLGKRN